MNERIFDIAMEVLKDQPTLESWTFTRLELEKFAELIVRECANIADEPTSRPFDSYGKKIKQHFGVEE